MRFISRGRIVLVSMAIALVLAGCGGSPEGSSASDEEGDGYTSSPVTTTTQTEPPDGPLEELNEPLPEAPSGAFQDSQIGEQGLSPEYVYTYLEGVVRDADRVWSDYFAKIGLAEPYVTYLIVRPGEQNQSECGMTVVTDTANAYYCPTDIYNGQAGAIWLPLETFTKMWNGDIFGKRPAVVGDFAAAAVAAHEFGHHVVDELMLQLSLPAIEAADGSNIKESELIADCFSGVWSYTAYYSGYLEGTDVEKAVTGLNAIGDAGPGGESPHGSPDERAAAFQLGYNNGDPATCINAYWPGAIA